MKTLLWREFHWNRLVLVMGASILVVPYVFVLFIDSFDSDYFTAAALYSFVISQLTIAFLGGNAFAGERADRSAQFLAYLPISRKKRLLSKLCLTAIVVAVIVFVNLLVFRIADGRFPWQTGEADGFIEVAKNVAGTGIVMFGVGWFISSFQSSPTFAIGGGIAVPVLTIIALTLVIVGYEIRDEASVMAWYPVICGILGTLGFGLGTWLFLKCVEP